MKEKNYQRKNKIESKKLAPANYLIICEGKKTEPNYFNGLKKEINRKYGKKIDVIIPNIDIKGTGLNTISLIKYAEKKVNQSNKIYGKVWVVFDKDDYPDDQFDTAIKNCEYNIAWSNPNFELWILSHFKKINRFISKDNILIELDKEFQKNNLGKYMKNDSNLFNKITLNKDFKKAIENCKEMEKINKKGKPSKRNPMTKVYKIVEELEEYLE